MYMKDKVINNACINGCNEGTYIIPNVEILEVPDVLDTLNDVSRHVWVLPVILPNLQYNW